MDVVSNSGGSNWNHQSVPMVAASSSIPIVVSLSVPVIASAGDMVASPSFATNLHCDDIAEQGANMNTPVMILMSRAVREPDAVEDVLREDNDVELATITDDSDDDIGRSSFVGSGGASSSETQQYPQHFSTLDLDAMRPEGLPNVQSGFGARDSQDTTGLAEFQIYSIRRGIEYKVMESNHDKYYGKCQEFGNSCRWLIWIMLRRRKGIWEVRRYNRPHTCLATSISSDHKKLDYHVISAYILPMIRAYAAVSIILKRNRTLFERHIKSVSLRPPPLHKCTDQRLINLN
ncbi:hypothetical protein Ahy_A10g050467 [Arachis hypogaea]|uniref:Uncharacterized protein n=1 Tax=Arachis hypogaea TaxID=3818 RepID=A0A445B9F6_ARAHY|nr:hypothetical protein Ahy_A10g050467 [Arachis hypogaea]